MPWLTVRAATVACLALLLSSLAAAQPFNPANISKGAYLARVGDCVACHTAGPQAPPFADGLPLNSPFGVIYSSNITPDPVNGIGGYTLYDFSRAVRNGIAKGWQALVSGDALRVLHRDHR